MACFPRFHLNRSKNMFTPATDNNNDTILNNKDSNVQIGRYIRREETTFLTPKKNEQKKMKETHSLDTTEDKFQQEQVYKLHNNSNHLANVYNRICDINNIHDNAADNNLKKKFISNKFKLKINNNNNINTNEVNNKLTNRTQVQNKLKPVKERRATALPINALNNLDNEISVDDEADDNSVEKKMHHTEIYSFASTSLLKCYIRSSVTRNASNTAAHTPTIEKAMKFYIGSDYAAHKTVKEDNCNKKSEDVADIGMFVNANFDHKETEHLPALEKQNSSNDNIYVISNDNKNNIYIQRNLQLSRTSSYQNLGNINIPPPPPMPPTPLTTLTPTISIISHKTKKCACNSFRKISTAHECFNDGEYDILNQNKDHTFQMGSKNSAESPKSHRIDGGIIFQRPNLPENINVKIVHIEKDEDTRNLIRNAIERNDFLNNYMDKERKEMVIDAMAPISFNKDSYIIHEEDEGSEIYVAEDGFFDVIKEGKVVGSFGPMTVFGELAILYNAKRQASIKASTNARVWKIERETFREIMKISGSKERQENLNFLRTAPFLNDLSENVLNKIVDLLRKKFFETNNCIVREGEVGNEFFIIRGGTVTIKKKNEENIERVVDRRKRGDYFGEQALLNADHRQASVYADAPGTEVLILEREAFISYLGTIPQLHAKPIERELTNELDTQRKKSEFDNEYANVQLSELKKIATLGAGAFGRVDLVAYGEKTFALKIIKKIDVVKQDQVEHVYNEKRVMIKCHSSPFIIELYKTYRNEKFVYFLMEACMGGDVWTVMSQRRFFDEKTARFLAGCVVEAFDFLHSNDIIYRDLKPENLMLTTDGYCKLVDFGFAKQIPANQKTNTFAGTPEYVAPEIILDRGHDRAVDYWALGILIFELLVGKTPFRGQSQIKIYQQILGGIDVITMPSKIPKSAQNLIKNLCKQLPAERLGYQRRGIQDIKKHSWFDSLDWNKLKNKQLPSPIKRPITGNTDIQYFVPIGVENEKEPPDEMSGWDIDF